MHMKLLICTQVIDKNDPVLGFFHRWIEEFADKCEQIVVVCLKEGEHSLPQNVQILSLGKEKRRSRAQYIRRFYSHIVRERNNYDAVLVHMNQEYMLLGGLLWRLWGKRIALWRNHKMGSVLTWISCKLAHVVCHTSPSAYVASYRNAVRMPIGIDIEQFMPGTSEPHSVLFLGRFDPVKKPELFLEAMEQLEKEGVALRANIYGDPTAGNEKYAQKIKERFKKLRNVSFHSSVGSDDTSSIYSAHSIYVNLTPPGSFDKTMGEAMASGCVVVAANDAVRRVIPEELFIKEVSIIAVAEAIKHALQLSDEARVAVAQKSREYVEQEHSLVLLSTRLFEIFSKSK